MLSNDEHQLLEPIDGGVAGVFADLLRESAGVARELGRMHFALTDTLVVSGRRAALGAIQRTLDALGRGKKLPDAIALLEEIVSHFADSVALVAQELSDTLDAIEEGLIDDALAGERAKLGPARRTAVRIHRQLSTLRLLFAAGRRPTAPARRPASASPADALLSILMDWTMKSSPSRNAPGCCRTRSLPRSPPKPTAICSC